VIDELKSNGKDREAGQLRTVLNGNVGKAYANAREAGWLQSRGSVEREQSRRYVTLKEWRVMDAPTRAAVLVAGDRGNTSLNAQDENSIEWALRSWNPVTGCLHNCSYCYARDIANRFYESKFAPVLWPDRLWAPSNVKVPAEASTQIAYKNVFTCSMADLFGRWVPTEWIEAVLDVVRDNHQWNFLFLTKFPGRLSEFRFPTNAWVGATVDAQARVPFVEKAFASVTASVKWLSCEPLLEPLQFERLDLFQWIVLGGASRSTETPDFRPPRRWITDLERQAIDAGCKVYEKTNLLERLRQYPGAQSTVDVDVPVEFKMGYLQRDLKDWQTYEREVTR
jgi:protein gp37